MKSTYRIIGIIEAKCQFKEGCETIGKVYAVIDEKRKISALCKKHLPKGVKDDE